jgi:hypothetical protein
VSDPVADYERLSAALAEWGETVSQAVLAVWSKVVEAMRPLLAYLRELYDAAGQPYGPDDAAMWRWWHEIAPMIREAREREAEAAWQRGLAYLREAR